MPESLSGGAVVARTLEQLGVTDVFGVASIHNLPIFNAIARRGAIRTVNVRHEQAAVHAADAYSRVTGRLGVAITSTGPGAANSMGGLFEAEFASSPVLTITGQVETRYLGKGWGYIHEAERQQPMLATLTREALTVRQLDEVADTLVHAARTALTGRPRPVAVEIPIDLQFQEGQVPPVSWAAPTPQAPDAGAVTEAARLLQEARRPVLWAGGGVIRSGAEAALAALARRLDIPVVTSVEGRGSLSDDDPLCAGSLTGASAMRQLIESADLVLAVGTHFQMYQTAFWKLRLPKLVHIDIDPGVFDRRYQAEHTIVADARLALEALVAEVGAGNVEEGWLHAAQVACETARETAFGAIGADHRQISDSIRRHLPDDGIIVRDPTIPAYTWADALLPVRRARTSLRSTSRAIGPGLPLAIGAAVGSGTPVVAIHGDGGLMLSLGELATAAQYRLPVTLCVFNDGGYGVLRGIERTTFPGPSHDVDLMTPDFVTLANAMGWTGTAVSSPAEFDTAFAAAVAAGEPNLIEIDMTALTPITHRATGRPLHV